MAVGSIADISKLHAASIFRVEDGGSMYLRNVYNIGLSHNV
jgi:hypothetical protein